jgi:biopolymer transport protein ExbB
MDMYLSIVKAALAKGIGLILNATLMGLLIAIPALIFWSYYNKKVETMAVEMETICDEFLRRQYRKGKSK